MLTALAESPDVSTIRNTNFTNLFVEIENTNHVIKSELPEELLANAIVIKTETDIESNTALYPLIPNFLFDIAANCKENEPTLIKTEKEENDVIDNKTPKCVKNCMFSDISTSDLDITSSYTNCFIERDWKTSNYNCKSCPFSTTSIEAAVSHFVFNDNDSCSNTLMWFNIKNYTFECNKCKFNTFCDIVAINHWREHECKAFLKCFICSFAINENSALKAHLICHLNKMCVLEDQTGKESLQHSIRCIKCKISCSRINILKRHYLRFHGQKRFSCAKCNTQCYFIDQLKIHMRSHSRECSGFNHIHTNDCTMSTTTVIPVVTTKLHIFKCHFCPFSAISNKFVKIHIQIEHAGEVRKLICDLCYTSFSSKRSLDKHKQRHEHETLKCEQCDFKTMYARSLAKHINNYHTGESLQLCYVCGFQNHNAETMILHISRHSAIKNVSCNICGYRCSHNSILSRHMAKHDTERKYSCHLCGCRFKVKGRLRKHIIQTHIETSLLNNKRFTCRICNYKCNSESVLNNHAATHSPTRKHFYCFKCGKEFLNKNSWKLHELSHSNVRPYNCAICSAGFMALTRLENHMKRHTGVGRMYCYECNYSSTHKANFTKHVNKTCTKAKHAHENQMYCYRCGYASNQRSNFINHANKGCHKIKKKVLNIRQ